MFDDQHQEEPACLSTLHGGNMSNSVYLVLVFGRPAVGADRQWSP